MPWDTSSGLAPVNVPLWHGTPTEAAHSVLCNGLRVLSGTHHESSGAVFGGGVYATSDLPVAASQFTRAALGCRLLTVFQVAVQAAPTSRVVVGGYTSPLEQHACSDGGGFALPPSAYVITVDAAHVAVTQLCVWEVGANPASPPPPSPKVEAPQAGGWCGMDVVAGGVVVLAGLAWWWGSRMH